MSKRLEPELYALLQSDDPYDTMTFIRGYCKTCKYKTRWNTALSKRIYPQLREIISKKYLTSNKIYEALKFHCKSPHYLRILVKRGIRYNINGKPDGTVSREEGSFAWEELCKHHPNAAAELRAQHKRKKLLKVNEVGQGQEAPPCPKPKRVFKFNPRT